MKSRDKLILETKAWAEEMHELDTNFFRRLSDMHQPNILWICSSDSLIPIREVTNTDPGEILVYRNVANQISLDDTGFVAVLEEALATSPLELIVVCGYSHCSGIRDVLNGCDGRPHVQRWLQGLQQIYATYKSEIDAVPIDDRARKLSEYNIHQQIDNLARMDAVQKSWQQNKKPQLLGWYLDLPTGTFTEITRVDPPTTSS